MGLLFEKKFTSNITGNYWKIVSFSVDYFKKQSSISLALYKDKDSRDAQASPIDYFTYSLSGDAFPVVNPDLPIDSAYQALRVNSEFFNAQDVIEKKIVQPEVIDGSP